MKYLKILPATFLTFLIAFTAVAQETPDEPKTPVDLIIRSQVEGMMIQQNDVIMEHYHKDIQLIQFPSEPLANGKEEASKYWKDRFAVEKEVAYDMVNYLETNGYFFTKVRRFDQVKGKESFLAIIYVIKDGKVTSVYFL